MFPGKSSLGELKTKLILGYTDKTLEEFLEIIELMFFDVKWNGQEYSLISRNCQNYCQEL